MNAAELLSYGLRTFFVDELRLHENVSPNTVLAYRDAVKLLLRFAAERHAVCVAALTVEHLDVQTVLAFLEHLETRRGVTVATRNHRLAALRSFFRHLAPLDPQYFHQCQRVLGIPFKRGEELEVEYLTEEELAAILAQPDRTTPAGQRDYVLFALMYNSGCRVQEILDLRPCDICLQRPYQIRVMGKGRKERVCPLWAHTAKLVEDWFMKCAIAPTSQRSIFLNQRGERLTRFGVWHILKKYVERAVAAEPSLSRKRIHPHSMRHTSAVHMLQAGLEVNMIGNIMGHASNNTTNRYARINMEAKREAIEALRPEGSGTSEIPRWHKEKDLLAWLEAL